MSRRLESLLLVASLGLAGLLRMGWPGVTEFKLDEARAYALALDLAQFRSVPLQATDMSVGLPNSPLTIYLYALPLFFWHSPVAATFFGAALNTAAVALLYVMARRYWGVRAALLTALLYAVAPWAVLYSRKIWAPNLLPVFVVGYVFSGLLAFVENRWRWLAVHLVLLSAVVQLHVSSIALAPATAALLVACRRRVDWRWVAFGLAGAALLAVPFALHLVARPDDWTLAARPLADR